MTILHAIKNKGMENKVISMVKKVIAWYKGNEPKILVGIRWLVFGLFVSVTIIKLFNQ